MRDIAAELAELSASGDVLIVDDSPEARLIRSRALQRAGFAVRRAETAGAGYAAIAEQKPDVVVLDVNLPDAHGFEVCRRIKAEHVEAPIAVVQVSASSVGTDEQVSGLEGGADAYLTEPIDPAVLVATVRAVLRERRTSAALRQANQRLGFAQQAADAGVWDLGADASWWSEELAVLQGIAPDAAPTLETWLASIHPEDRPRVAGLVGDRAPDGQVLDVEVRLAADARRWVHLSGRAEDGRLTGLTMDVTRRRRTQERLGALQRLTAELSATADPDEVLARAVAATWRALDTETSSIGVRRGDRIAVTFGVPHEDLEARYSTLDLTDDAHRSLPAAHVTLTGETVAVSDPASIAERFPVLWADPDLTDMHALLIVPLGGAATPRGFLAAYSYRTQVFDDADLDALNAIAQVCTQALERAELYAAEGAARSAAERAARRARLRAEAIETLERLRTLDERREALAAFCATAFAAEASIRPAGEAPPDHRPDASIASVTLITRGSSAGDLVLVRDTPFTADDRDLLAEIAAPAALSLDNARLDDEQRHIARTLQFSLLQGALTDLPATASAALRYLPGKDGLVVGGDWHDVLQRRDGRIAVIVGDVAGHDLAAAATMGLARNAARALARVLDDPAAILTELDGLLDGSMATAACVLLDPATGALDYACGGHPPPLVVRAGGSTDYLQGGRALPLAGLGVARETATATLGPGDLLLLYTDGLIERRGVSLADGLAELAERAGALADAPTLADVADGLLGAMTDASPTDDDIAVVVVRRAAVPADAGAWRGPVSRADELLSFLATRLVLAGLPADVVDPARAAVAAVVADLGPGLRGELDLEFRIADGAVRLVAGTTDHDAAAAAPDGWAVERTASAVQLRRTVG